MTLNSLAALAYLAAPAAPAQVAVPPLHSHSHSQHRDLGDFDWSQLWLLAAVLEAQRMGWQKGAGV